MSDEKKRDEQKDEAVNLSPDSQNHKAGGNKEDTEVKLKAVEKGQQPEVRDIAQGYDRDCNGQKRAENPINYLSHRS